MSNDVSTLENQQVQYSQEQVLRGLQSLLSKYKDNPLHERVRDLAYSLYSIYKKTELISSAESNWFEAEKETARQIFSHISFISPSEVQKRLENLKEESFKGKLHYEDKKYHDQIGSLWEELKFLYG